jgi:serine/threonine protein phosphatase PrpC
MSSPSTDHNDTPPENLPTEPALPDADLEEAAAELAAATPKTLPLKRSKAPLFVPAVLPKEADAPEPEPVAAPAPAPAPAEPDAVVEEPPVPASDSDEEQKTDSEPALPVVEFSPPPDVTYRASMTLELHCATPSAQIRYALGAEDVTESDPIYSPADKIFLSQSTTVAARAFVNERSGPVATGRYEIVLPAWLKLEPVDQSDATTHEASDHTTLEGPWQLAAASVRGKLHAHRGGWREDAFRHGLAHAVDGTYSIVVVSDGAGSAPLSRVSSNLACQVALDSLRAGLTSSPPLADETEALIERDLPALRSHLVEAAQAALQKVQEEATTRARPIGDFSATLLILVRREWNGQQLCASLQVGDGGIALWSDDSKLTLLGEADHGTQSGETRFLTSQGVEGELASRVKFSVRPNLRAVAVMTDGVADDFFPEGERFPDIFKGVLPLVEQTGDVTPGAALLKWISYDKKGSADDRALVVCWRPVGTSPEPAENGQPDAVESNEGEPDARPVEGSDGKI